MTRPGRRDGFSADDFAAYERLTSLPLEDETEHESLVFEHADVRGAKAEHVVLTDVQLQSVDAQGAALPRLAVRDALFADCDLSNARLLGASLVWVDLRGCRATGLDVTESTLRHVTFHDCKIDLSLFRFTRTESVRFVDCILTGADFSGAALGGAVLEGCDLTGADLSFANLEHADLRTTRLESLRGAGSLRGATIDPSQLVTLAPALASELGIRVEGGDGG